MERDDRPQIPALESSTPQGPTLESPTPQGPTLESPSPQGPDPQGPDPQPSNTPSPDPQPPTAHPAATVAPGAAAAVVFAVVLSAYLLIEQGGYFADASAPVAVLLFALAVCTLLRARLRVAVRVLAPMLLLAGVCAAGLASAVSHGLSYVELASMAPWLVFFASVFAAGLLRPPERSAVVSALAWLGVAASAIGILMFAGVVTFQGGLGSSDGKLNFYFQYAPTAGSFFCAMAVLAIGSPDLRLRWAAFLPLAALTLTLSGGVAIVALAAFGALALVMAARLDFSRLAALVVQASLALLVCIVGFKVSSGLTVHIACAGVAVCAVCGIVQWRLSLRRDATDMTDTTDMTDMTYTESAVPAAPSAPATPSAQPRKGIPRLRLRVALMAGIAAAVVIVCALALAIFGGRVGTDVGNFLERVAHMRDAIVLWSENPLLGVGPGRWQFEYRFVESASYWTKFVHCGYLQLLCEYGIVAFACLLAAIALLVRGLVRRLRAVADGESWNARLAVLVAASVLLVHAAIDWDFAFGAIFLVLGVLITPPASSPAALSQPAAPPSPVSLPNLCQKFHFVHWAPLRSPNEQSGISGTRGGGDEQSGISGTRGGADEQSGISGTGERGAAASEVPPDEQSGISGTRKRGVTALLGGSVCAVLAVGMLVLSYASFEAYETRNDLIAGASSDVLSTLETVEADPLALADTEIETKVLNNLVTTAHYQTGIDFVEACGGHSGNAQSVSYAACLYGVGRVSDAERVLIDALWAEPRTRVLFSQVKELFEMHGLSAANSAEYHEAVDHANELLTQGMNPLTNRSTEPMPEYL